MSDISKFKVGNDTYNIKDEEAEQAIEAIETALANKVDKVAGKGLSTNDYDDTEKGKVTANAEAIEAMADEVAIIGKYRKFSSEWITQNQTWKTGITESCTCLISLQGYSDYCAGLILAQKFGNGQTYVQKLIDTYHFNVTFVDGEMQCSTDSVSDGVFSILFLNKKW